MKVAFVSNSPWAGTGYGQQAALVLPHLLERYGKDSTACMSLYGLMGAPLKLDGIQHYPMGVHPYSDDVLCAHARHWFGDEPGMVILLFDVWIFQNPEWAELPVVAAWCPVDHMPVPLAVATFFRRSGAIPIAMSKFGRDWLRKRSLDPLYVPHAIDRAVMKPTPVLAGRPSRDVFGIGEDRYVVGMVAANKGVLPNRKSFPEAFQGYATWLATDEAQALDRRPLLYVHADPVASGVGINLYDLAEACGLSKVDVQFADEYACRLPLPAVGMAGLFSSFDVLLQPSMGEGFGIPALEAQACGVPVVGTDFSAQPEVIEAGWVVNGTPSWDPVQRSWLVLPSVPSIVEALKLCSSRTPDKVAEDSATALAHADLYDVNRVWSEHWEPALDVLEARSPSAEPISVPAHLGRAA